MTLPALPPISSLESYIHAVNAVPMLTAERELELGRRLKEHDDLSAASGLVMSHLRLVVSVARNYMGYGLPQGDLIQEGNIGLMKAVKESDVIEMEQRLQGGDVALEPAPTDGDEVVTPIAYLTDASEGPAESYERRSLEALESGELARALGSLDERSRRIIRARWLGESKSRTLHELADEFGVSAERIRQIETKAMQKMKKHLVVLQ